MEEVLNARDRLRWDVLVAAPDANGCRIWMGSRSGFGHGQFRWRGKIVGAHRLAWRVANGNAPIPAGLVVRHRCNRAACVEGSHLELGTQADNVADMLDAGRAVVGEAHYAAKLTEATVLEAREMYAAGGHTITALAARFGVTDMVMRDVLVGKTWRHITGGAPVSPPRPFRITPEERAQIVELHRQGWTHQAIADQLGRSLTPVIRVLWDAGFKQPRPGRKRVTL